MWAIPLISMSRAYPARRADAMGPGGSALPGSRPGPLDGGESPPTSLVEVDDRRRVVGTERAALERRERPRRVDVLCGDAHQLGDPLPDVVAVGIEALALPDRREDAIRRLRVGAGAGDPLPVAVVLRELPVEEERHEVAFAVTPVEEEVTREERRG